MSPPILLSEWAPPSRAPSTVENRSFGRIHKLNLIRSMLMKKSIVTRLSLDYRLLAGGRT